MTIKTRRSRRARRRRLTGSVGMLAGAAVAGTAGYQLGGPPERAEAHIWTNAHFPSNGFLWASPWKNNYGVLMYTTNNCASGNNFPRNIENDTFPRITNSSQGLQWANGMVHWHWGCGFGFGSYPSVATDTGIYYDGNQSNFDQGGGSYIGGRVQRQLADSAFCTYWGVGTPCGSRNWVQINMTKWVNSGDPVYKRRHLMHENGHAQGLADATSPCTEATIMRSGSPCAFHTYDGWQDHDRVDISSVYK